MTDLHARLASLGDPGPPTPASLRSPPRRGIRRRRGSAGLGTWGKGRPRGGCPAHLLLLPHARRGGGWRRCSSRASSHRLSASAPRAAPGRPTWTALQWVLYVIALHDLGKASPAFQMQLLGLSTRCSLDYDFTRPRARHHGDLGFVLLTPVLQGRRRRQVRGEVRRSRRRGTPREFAGFDSLPRRAVSLRRGAPKRAGRREAGDRCRTAALFLAEEAAGPHAHADVVILAGLTAVAD